MEYIEGTRPLARALDRVKALRLLDQGYTPNVVRLRLPDYSFRFVLFHSYAEHRFWRASMDFASVEAHRVVLDGPRALHVDIEMELTVARERFEEQLWRLRCCVFSLVRRFMTHEDGRPYSHQDHEHLVEAICERDPAAPNQSRHSAHLVFPQILLRDNLAEFRFMHALLKSCEAVRAALPDMALYHARKDATHSLRMARCVKLGKPESLLVCRTHTHNLDYHDPSWVEEDDRLARFLLTAELFDPVPGEARRVALGPNAPPKVIRVPDNVQDFVRRVWPGYEFTLRKEGVLTGVQVGPCLPSVILRPKPDFSYFSLAMLMLSYTTCSFEGYYELVRRLRPDSAASGPERLHKYKQRYNSAVQHYSAQLGINFNRRIAKFLPNGMEGLPLFCPFAPQGTATCRLSFVVHYNEKSERFFVHCMGCQNMRQVCSSTTFPRTTFFCRRYVNEHLGLGRTAGDARSTLVLNAGMGLGKTKWLSDELRFSEPSRVLFVTVRRVLADCFVGRFGCELYSSTSGQYFEWYERQSAGHLPAWMAIQLESLKRLGASFRKHEAPLPEVDVLVLDEYWSLLTQVASSTMDKRHRDCVSVLLCLMRLAKHVVVLDADAQADGVPFDIIRETRADHTIEVLYNMHLPVPLKRYELMDYEVLVEQLYQRIFDGRTVGICSGSLLEANALKQIITERLQFDSQGERDYDSLTYSSQSTQEEMETLRDADHAWLARNVMFTPTVTVGFDYNPEVPEEAEREIYILCSSSTASPATMLQMAGRFRRSARMYIAMLPAAVTAVRNLRPLTVTEVLDACDANTKRYRDTITAACDGDYDEHGYFRVDREDALCRIAGWCKAERNSAMRSYVTVLRLLLLQHGEQFEDKRALPEEGCDRPALLAETLTQVRWEAWLADCQRYTESPVLRDRVAELYDFAPPPVPLMSQEYAFLQQCLVPNTLLRCWMRLGGHEGRFDDAEAVALYQSDLAGHGHFTGLNDTSHPLYHYHHCDEARDRPVAFNQFLAHTVCWVTRLLQPFMRATRGGRFVEGTELLEQHYGTAFFHENYLLPLKTPDNAPLLELVGLTATQLERPLARTNSMSSMLRKCLGLFNLTTTRQRARHGMHTAYGVDWTRLDQICELMRGHSIHPQEVLPLGMTQPPAGSIL